MGQQTNLKDRAGDLSITIHSLFIVQLAVHIYMYINTLLLLIKVT